MSSQTDTQLFEDTFNITTVSAQKYDRVSRLHCTTSNSDTLMTLDINSELYPCSSGENITVCLASSLALDGGVGSTVGMTDGEAQKGAGGSDEMWRDVVGGTNASGVANLADMYEYVCRGKIYRFEEGSGENLKVYISFGGLLMFMDGPFKKLTALRIDYVYLCVKK